MRYVERHTCLIQSINISSRLDLSPLKFSIRLLERCASLPEEEQHDDYDNLQQDDNEPSCPGQESSEFGVSSTL